MNRAFSVPHSKHAQPSCPTLYTRLVPVPSDQAFPTLQQLLILQPSYPFIPSLIPALHSLQLSVHSCSPFIPYESLTVRILHSFFILYESSIAFSCCTNPPWLFRAVRIVVCTNRRPFHSVRIVHDLTILCESSSVRIFLRTNRFFIRMVRSVRIVSLSVRFVIRTNRYLYESLSDCTCLPLLLCLVFSFGVGPCY